MKTFNVAGPCNQEKHYMIEASTRLKGVEDLIYHEQYFVIHAARQSGKTTYLFDLTKRLNAEGKYYAVYCSLEGLQYVGDAKEGIPLIVECIKKSLRICKVLQRHSFGRNIKGTCRAKRLFFVANLQNIVANISHTDQRHRMNKRR